MRDRLPPPWRLMTSRVTGDNASAQQAVGDWANQEVGGPVRGAFTSQWNVKFPASMSKNAQTLASTARLCEPQHAARITRKRQVIHEDESRRNQSSRGWGSAIVSGLPGRSQRPAETLDFSFPGKTGGLLDLPHVWNDCKLRWVGWQKPEWKPGGWFQGFHLWLSGLFWNWKIP